MSCPDWRRLAELPELPENTAGQTAYRRDDTSGWTEAVAHFDAGCPLCRRAALAAEPTLVFRRLRTVEMSSSQEASEVDAVRQAVAAMRTARRVDSLGTGRWARWSRWAAAAVLAVAALAIPGGVPSGGAGHRSASIAQAASARSSAVLPAAALPAAFTGEPDLPTVEGVNRPGARVYHMDGEGLSVVMIVDETLDV